MDVFEFRGKLVNDYEAFTRSFTRIHTEDIKRFVDEAYNSGRYWPVPLVQVNPNFKTGGTVEALVAGGALHPECGRIFRAGKSASSIFSWWMPTRLLPQRILCCKKLSGRPGLWPSSQRATWHSSTTSGL